MKRRDFLRNVFSLGAGLAVMPEFALQRMAEASWNTGQELPGVVVRQTNLDFRSLTNRSRTDAVIIHHIGNTDADVSAETVHQWHLANGWSGIGYHFLIRKDGTIEQGRPMGTIGAHCYGQNNHTIGINIVGNFEIAEPTDAQMDSAQRLVAAVCRYYGILPGPRTIFGHRDYNATACPGANLYARLTEIIAGARGMY